MDYSFSELCEFFFRGLAVGLFVGIVCLCFRFLRRYFRDVFRNFFNIG